MPERISRLAVQAAELNATLHGVHNVEQVDEEGKHVHVLVRHLERDELVHAVDGLCRHVAVVQHLGKSNRRPRRREALQAEILQLHDDPDPNERGLVLVTLREQLGLFLFIDDLIITELVELVLPVRRFPECWCFQSSQGDRQRPPTSDILKRRFWGAMHCQVQIDLFDCLDEIEELLQDFLPSLESAVDKHACHEGQEHHQEFNQVIQHCRVEAFSHQDGEARGKVSNCNPQ
mmetsp:Transcript_530/g.886  ORF Transcript_530/g.886 Transcript_530/m.886 type:complete len:233 (-) Transcript_530:421-1119(-)